MNRSSRYSARSPREKLRFAIVGAGAVTQSYLEAFEHCPEARVVAVADCRLEAAQRVAERMNCRCYDCADDMIREGGLDAAIVCTPPATHPDICLRLMQSKIHVLCEKPFSITSYDAQRMLDTAYRMGVKLTMASKYRYVDDIIRAKSMIASGLLGDLVLFENNFSQRVAMGSRWNARPEISGGGVLIDNGAHSVDLMHYFLGKLTEVRATEGIRCQGLAVEDTVLLFARSVSGVLCNVSLSWSIAARGDNFLDIYGTRGAISVGWKQSARLDFAHQEWEPFGEGYNKIRAFRKQIENFSRAIRGEEALLISAEDAVASVKIIECARQSLHQNQWIPVSAPIATDSRKNVH